MDPVVAAKKIFQYKIKALEKKYDLAEAPAVDQPQVAQNLADLAQITRIIEDLRKNKQDGVKLNACEA